ncbi:hypothetical protein ACFWBN_39520 [Streptomyces sp. NPDC059989]|uniref:effector-associated constant component EACC1 n=1 Tax=Streptomyces sp. NPDC059989 TaxID=3347026 RepID=UPI00367DA92E
MGSVIRITSPLGGQAPASLQRFLTADPEFRACGRARWEAGAPTVEGHLGTGLDVLTLVVTGVLALPAAIDTVRRWCTAPGNRDTSVELRAGGVTVIVSGTTALHDVAALATTLAAALEPTAPPSPPSPASATALSAEPADAEPPRADASLGDGESVRQDTQERN